MKRRISRRFRPTMTPGLDQLESRQLLSSGFQAVISPPSRGWARTRSRRSPPPTSGPSALSPKAPAAPLIENFNGTSWSQVASPAVERCRRPQRALPPCPVRMSGPWARATAVRPPGRIVQWHVLEHPDNAGDFGRRHAQRRDRHLAHRRLGRGRPATAGAAAHRALQRYELERRPAPSTTEGELKGISAASSTEIFAVGCGQGKPRRNPCNSTGRRGAWSSNTANRHGRR